MKSIHIVMHSVLYLKLGVTNSVRDPEFPTTRRILQEVYRRLL
jgi:hypothetical protein